MTVKKISETRFKCKLGDHDVEGVVINPGGWFGKVWLIQVAISNALNPFYAVEADSEQDAIDELADDEGYGHVINVDDDDAPEDDEHNEMGYTTAGNDGHWVDLNNVHIQKAPAELRYHVEWHPEQTDLSSVIDSELQLVRDEIADDHLNRDGSPVE